MSEILFKPNDRIKVISGYYTGRVGVFIKHCSSVFPEYGKIKLDLTKRERNQKVLMIKKEQIEHEQEHAR